MVLLFVIVPSFPGDPSRDPGAPQADARFPALVPSSRQLGRQASKSAMYGIHAVLEAIPRGRSNAVQCGYRSVSLRPHIRGGTTNDDETISQSAGAPAKSGTPRPATTVLFSFSGQVPSMIPQWSSDSSGITSPDSLPIENGNIPPPRSRSCGCKPDSSNNIARKAGRPMLFVVEMEFPPARSHDPPFPERWWTSNRTLQLLAALHRFLPLLVKRAWLFLLSTSQPGIRKDQGGAPATGGH